MSRTSLLAAALTLSVCLANASAASASSSSPTQASMGAAHALMSAKPGLLQRPQTLITPKQAAINKVKALLTTFFTDQQLSKILDAMAEDIYAKKPFKESFDTLIASGILTQSQMAILAKVGSGSQNDSGATSEVPLTKARAVLLRRFEPYYNNMSKTILAMRSNRKAKADCFNQVYVMVNKYLTKANVTPVLTEIKSSLTSKEWQSMRTHGSALFLWSRYGL
ncbi:hypothetical protein [Streptosporangium minutum]|uniref:hypothetical protein n=1 Tax=Streptosporangium minutum TaxID=569862 RepID=UPI0010559E30|nr:hypothetical protein [Streptosporangium minutum]